MIEELVACDEARIPVVWFVTHEEGRAEAEITMHAKTTNGELWVWSLTSDNGLPGWETPIGVPKVKEPPFNKDDSATPEGAVKCIIDYACDLELKAEAKEVENSKIIAIFRDPHTILKEDLSFIRMLRDASRELRDTEGLIVCISPEDKLPIDLKTDVAIIRPGLPTRDVIKNVLSTQLEQYGLLPYEQCDELADACVGLTLNQANDALAKSLTQFHEINLEFINKVKTEAISSVPGLTYIGETPSMDNVGGLDGLKAWLEERKKGFSQEARDENLPIPRGVLCLGVTGCGKSLIAKAVASYYEMPLICLNPPDIKGGIVGETEGNIRTVRNSIESLGNCVVWIDEFEKGLPKAGDRNLDGGTSDALLQGILNWFQERKGGAFIVATANDIKALPPELLRKGRWDSIFFVDLPTYKERIEIFNIHLNLREWKLSQTDVKTLAKQTENYSGAEIEAACIDGKWRAFGKKKPLSAEDILTCIKMEFPLYHTMTEQIQELRKWAGERARPASLDQSVAVKTRKKKPGGRKISLKNMEKIEDVN